MQGGREQQRLVHIRGAKALSHGRILSPYTLRKSCYVWCFCRIYSRQTPRETSTSSHDLLKRWTPCFDRKGPIEGGISLLGQMCRNYGVAQKPQPQALVGRKMVGAITVTELPRPDGVPELQEAQISPIPKSPLECRRHRETEQLGTNY